MKAIEIGSMVISVKANLSKFTGSMSDLKGRIKEAKLAAENFGTEIFRVKGLMLGLAGAAAITGGSLLKMLSDAVMSSPMLAGSMAKLKAQTMLFGNTIAKHLRPIVDKAGDVMGYFHKKFKELPEPVQGAIVQGLAYGGMLTGLTGIILGVIRILKWMGKEIISLIPEGVKTKLLSFGRILKDFIAKSLTRVASFLGTVASRLISFVAGSTAATAALGVFLGMIGVWIMSKTGILDWFRSLGDKFRESHQQIMDIASVLLVFPVLFGAMITDIVNGDFGFPFLKQGIQSVSDSFKRLKDDVIRFFQPIIDKIQSVIDKIMELKSKIPSLSISGLWKPIKEPESYQTGGTVPMTGLYRLHEGETVIPRGGKVEKSNETSIIVDFSGANINLASGIKLEEFADEISRQIASRQERLTY